MACHGSEAATAFGIPDLDEAFVRSYGDVRTALNPRDGGDSIVGEIAELSYSTRGRVPHVDSSA